MHQSIRLEMKQTVLELDLSKPLSAQPPNTSSSLQRSRPAGLLNASPVPAGGDDMYDDFAATFGRRHLSVGEYEHRRSVFHENRAFIEEWNAQATEADSHMLKLNQFADWSQVSMLWNDCILPRLCK